MSRILIGTSGFSYRDWVGPFYPPGTPSARMLEEYSRIFRTVEINSTYYAIPPVRTAESLLRRTGDDFLFTVKLPGEMTHKKGTRPQRLGGFSLLWLPFSRAADSPSLWRSSPIPAGIRRRRGSGCCASATWYGGMQKSLWSSGIIPGQGRRCMKCWNGKGISGAQWMSLILRT